MASWFSSFFGHSPVPSRFMKTQTDTPEFPALIPPQVVAEHLSVDERTVRRYVDAGLLTAVRIGPRLLRIHRASLLKLVGAR